MTSSTIHAFSSAMMTADNRHDGTCIYCDERLERLRSGQPSSSAVEPHYPGQGTWNLMACPSCRWWSLSFFDFLSHKDGVAYRYGYASAVFQKFRIDTPEIPVSEIQQYLLKRYDARYDIHPRKLEEILASVFHNHGFDVELTSYSKDGGVDLYLLRSPNGIPVAVQAKRNAKTRRIGVEGINAFLCTLVRHGFVCSLQQPQRAL